MPRPVIEYFGLSSFLVEYDTIRVVVDPWIDEPSWSVTSVADFDDLDHIFVTHGAHDHCADAYALAERTGATVTTEPALADSLLERGLPEEQVRRVIWGNAFTEDGIDVRVLETRHLSYFGSDGERLSGLPLGFHFGFDDVSFYYVGDTSIFSDLELFVRLNNPDVVLLPVGSAPGDLAPLPPRDAAEVASWLGEVTIIPVHYVPDSGEVDAFKEHLAATKQPEGVPDVNVLAAGERYEL